MLPRTACRLRLPLGAAVKAHAGLDPLRARAQAGNSGTLHANPGLAPGSAMELNGSRGIVLECVIARLGRRYFFVLALKFSRK
jgi:hypothetical protein